MPSLLSEVIDDHERKEEVKYRNFVWIVRIAGILSLILCFVFFPEVGFVIVMVMVVIIALWILYELAMAGLLFWGHTHAFSQERHMKNAVRNMAEERKQRKQDWESKEDNHRESYRKEKY